jgi:hypothetical protein
MSKAELDAFLAEQRTCRVATGSQNGPHLTALWYVWDGTGLWLYSVVRRQEAGSGLGAGLIPITVPELRTFVHRTSRVFQVPPVKKLPFLSFWIPISMSPSLLVSVFARRPLRSVTRPSVPSSDRRRSPGWLRPRPAGYRLRQPSAGHAGGPTGVTSPHPHSEELTCRPADLRSVATYSLRRQSSGAPGR